METNGGRFVESLSVSAERSFLGYRTKGAKNGPSATNLNLPPWYERRCVTRGLRVRKEF